MTVWRGGVYFRACDVCLLQCNLRTAGLSDGPLTYSQLLPFDQHHYHGVAAVDDMATATHIASGSMVLNIGSGLGGPARYLAGKYRASVTAVEVQDDLSRAAAELTARCGLADAVTHVCGDAVAVGSTFSVRKGGWCLHVYWRLNLQ